MTNYRGDHLVDRRRLKRRLGLWRLFALVFAAIALGAIFARYGTALQGPYIARLDVDGVILDDRRRTEALERMAEDRRIRALIVRIDSPGGTVVGGEALYRQLRDVAAEKPVVAVLRQLATSAAYMTALGSDYIVAREGTITGSIGVILQTTDVTGLLEMIGVKPEAIKSSPLKAQPNPLEPLTPEAREAIESVVSDVYDMFVDLVATRREMTKEDALQVADGRVFTGRQAKAIGLVDAIGGEDEAVAWLAEARGVDRSLRIRDVEVGDRTRDLSDLVLGAFGKAVFSERLTLDGLISLWHPAAAE